MRLLRRVLIVVGILAIAGYLGAMIWLVTRETAIVFAAGRPLSDLRPAAPFEQVVSAGAATGAPRQLLWIMRAATGSDTKPWVIFLHGNGANVASRMNILHYEKLRSLGLNVIAPEYRGFGGLDGVPTESGVDGDCC